MRDRRGDDDITIPAFGCDSMVFTLLYNILLVWTFTFAECSALLCAAMRCNAFITPWTIEGREDVVLYLGGSSGSEERRRALTMRSSYNEPINQSISSLELQCMS
ncbi:hypothetical protein VTL71DRAFT_12281 [Oculimacula yallundae]|uniref:Uncharacterized protein n=1 Tax=Oculimacula yallundae TaxID=86028 RepID=A0ABR4CNS2_9HELO